MEHYAHTSQDGRVQSVRSHLEGTALLAGAFAAPFGGESSAQAAGLLHDAGKYSQEFQRHIRSPELGLHVDHSTYGAQIAMKKGWLPVAFAAAGHHSGLPNGGTPSDPSESATLLGRWKRRIGPCPAFAQEIQLPEAALPFAPKSNYELAFFTRMLYSCLVDADFLDTETFMQGASAPRGAYEPLELLRRKVRRQADQWLSQKSGPLGCIRNDILRACLQSGETFDRGCYTLTVPTGGGKTFSSLAFALEHALRSGMERIIYVIPYTSIIDQTVSVFQDILGEENVLAHYSGAEHQLLHENACSQADYRKILAAENWDAPVIVTTAVQFFESLYASRSSRCRKLHNIANSVIIFDEAQTLPIPYLRPCLAAVAQLVKHYRASAVLCTATQPELQPILNEFGLKTAEICLGTESLYRDLRRTTLQDIGELAQDALETQLAAESQVLCVVNRRKLAQTLFDAMPEEGRYCLTTLLCAHDRKEKLSEIRERLKSGKPCRVISTSLIEAGVDVDFPLAYREQAGLDSVLQAAGRCNREGKRRAEESFVRVFSLEGTKPPRMLLPNLAAWDATRRVYPEMDTPEAIHHYFEALLCRLKSPQELDQKKVLDAFEKGRDGCQFPFAAVAEEFHLIESPTKNIYLPVGEGAALCRALQEGQYGRALLRKLGMYAVGVYPDHFAALCRAGALDVQQDGSAVLTDPRLYDPDTGLAMDVETGQGWFL